jgi:streptogramin lyase
MLRGRYVAAVVLVWGAGVVPNATGFAVVPSSIRTIAPPAGMIEYSRIELPGSPPLGLHSPLAVGPEGEVWFLGGYVLEPIRGEVIGRLDRSGILTGAFTVPTPPFTGFPGRPNLTQMSDHSVWFTAFGDIEGGLIAHITPAGKVTEYALTTTPYQGPRGVAEGPSGEVWFTDSGDPAAIGRISPQGTESSYPAGEGFMELNQIALGSDGNMWFASEYPPEIGRINSEGIVKDFPIAAPAAGLALGPEGDMWFTEPPANTIGRISTTGAVTEIAVPGVGESIVLGADGNLWYADPSAHGIGRITPAHVVTIFAPLPEGFGESLAVGHQNDIWFTDGADTLARLIIPFAPVSSSPPTLSGSAVEGAVLSASTGGWSNGPSSFAYEWQVCNAAGAECTDVEGQAASQIALSPTDVSHTLRTIVTASNAAGAVSAASNVSAVVAPAPTVSVHQAPQTPVLGATITWLFHSRRIVEEMLVNHLPVGGEIEVRCVGRGCPFLRWHAAVVASGNCHKKHCPRRKGVVGASTNLASLFRGRRLAGGARISVTVTDAGFLGKRFVFVVHAKRPPDEQIECLSPGSSTQPSQCPNA